MAQQTQADMQTGTPGQLWSSETSHSGQLWMSLREEDTARPRNNSDTNVKTLHAHKEEKKI